MDGAGGGRGDGEGGEHGIQFGAGGGVAKGGQRQGRVAADHGFGIVNQAQESGVEGRVAAILSHDPGGGLAQFEIGAGGFADDVGIPARDVGAAGEALAHLYQGVLGVAGMEGVGEVFGELGVGELAAEPGFIPEEKRQKDEQEGQGGDEDVGFFAGAAGGGHASLLPGYQRRDWGPLASAAADHSEEPLDTDYRDNNM